MKTASYDVRQVNGAGYPRLLENKIVVDKTYGHLAYGCGGCCAYCSAFLDPNPYTDTVGNGTWNTVIAQDCCDQWQDDVTNLAYGWGSDNPPVATVGNAYTQLVGVGYANGSSSVQLQSGGHIKSCHVHGYTPRARNNGVPTFNVAYSSYIPVDHVTGPTLCHAVFPLIYLGDANRGTYRTTESINIVPDKQMSSGFFPNAGQTRNYGPPSPVNGNTISAGDEDNIPNDCYLWNASQTADSSGFQHDEYWPYPHGGVSHYHGSACNPLETPCATIDWDMRTGIDATNPQAPTAYVSYTHTWYPSHQVKVNGQIVYIYTPPDNGAPYIAKCLFLKLGTVTGQNNAVTVPAH